MHQDLKLTIMSDHWLWETAVKHDRAWSSQKYPSAVRKPEVPPA